MPHESLQVHKSSKKSVVKQLFLIIHIREGEFLRYRGLDVREILRKEFLRIYSYAFVDRKEELEKVNLQALLDGAHPQDLDIAVLPKGFKMDPGTSRS